MRESNRPPETLRCCVMIPAYNAAETLPEVIDRVPDRTWALIERVFIINDGSTDATAAVAKRLTASFPKLEVHSLERNSGYGRAVGKGLELARTFGTAYAVCLHADGQYPPEKIAEFLVYMHENGIDVLQGSRHKHGTARAGGMPLYKLVAGRLLVSLENRVFGLQLTDYHSGFLFYSRKAIEKVPFGSFSGSFDFDLETIATANRMGLRIDELGIPTQYGREKSHLNPMTYGMRVLRILLRDLLGHYRRLARQGRLPAE